jgi:hypothetical protein
VRREVLPEHLLLGGREPGNAAAREEIPHALELHLPHRDGHRPWGVNPVAARAALAENARAGRVRIGQTGATPGREHQRPEEAAQNPSRQYAA